MKVDVTISLYEAEGILKTELGHKTGYEIGSIHITSHGKTKLSISADGMWTADEFHHQATKDT